MLEHNNELISHELLNARIIEAEEHGKLYLVDSEVGKRYSLNFLVINRGPDCKDFLDIIVGRGKACDIVLGKSPFKETSKRALDLGVSREHGKIIYSPDEDTAPWRITRLSGTINPIYYIKDDKRVPIDEGESIGIRPDTILYFGDYRVEIEGEKK